LKIFLFFIRLILVFHLCRVWPRAFTFGQSPIPLIDGDFWIYKARVVFYETKLVGKKEFPQNRGGLLPKDLQIYAAYPTSIGERL